MTLHSLHELLVSELRDLYDAELQLMQLLPKFAEATSTPALSEAFRDHLDVTEMQVERLNAIFNGLAVLGSGRRCWGMKGLVAEAKEAMWQCRGSSPAVRDASLIAVAQRVEHYEMAAYGAAMHHAAVSGHDQIAALLHASLGEEKAAKEAFSAIAEDQFNAERAFVIAAMAS